MKRTLLLLLIFILAGWVFVPAAHAQLFNPMPNALEFGKIVDDKTGAGQMSKEVYTTNTQASYMNTATCMITGCSPNPASGFYYGKSAVASIQNMAVAMYANPPADLALWIRDTGQTLGFIPKKTYAQGIGFSGLSPLLPIWKAFRNIAYALLAVVMIAIGFMVMFRKKIDPKTVVTVQNALPKIVLTLLLITFSYAIVGLMIDLMYLLIALTAALLIPVSNGALSATTATDYVNGGVGTLFLKVFGGGLSAVDDITRLMIGFWGTGANSTQITLISWLTGMNVIVGIIVAIALVFAWIRILFLLVGAYIQILISLFVGPLQILTEAFPGSTGFSSWFKNVFANIAVFPIAAGMLMIGQILASFNKSTSLVWTPPLLSSNGASGWVGIIGLGILFAIPGLANSLKEAIKAKGINAGPGAILGPIGSGVGQAMQMGYQASFMKQSIGGHKQAPAPNNDMAESLKSMDEGIKTLLEKSHS